MREPTDEQLREYAGKLPAIYRDILAAFPGVAPRRRAGDALIRETIEGRVAGMDTDHRTADVAGGLARLVERGFLERGRELPTYAPTPLGERLIHILTGHEPVPGELPELPVPAWG